MNNNILKNIFRASLAAMIIADLANVVAAIIDGMLTGRFLGAESIAAFGISKPFFSITGILSAVLSSGAMTVASHMIGKGDNDNANQIFSTTCILGMALSVGAALTGILLVNQFAGILGARGELFPIVRKYLLGLLPGVPAIVMGNVLVIFLQLEGKFKNVSLSVFATAAVNLCGDMFNIFYLNGDMFGVGLATSLSYYATLAVLMYNFVTGKSALRLSFFNLRWGITSEVISKGLPKATRRLCNVFRPVLINHLVLFIGGTLAMSALSVQNSASDFLDLLGTCCGDVVALMCGIFYGEENEDDLSETLCISFRYVLFGVTAISLLCLLGAEKIALFYLGDKQKSAVEITAMCMKFYAFRLPFLAFNEIYMNYFQAIGDTKRSHILSVFQRLIYLVVSAYILGRFFGIAGVWAAFPVSELMLSVTIIIMAAIHEKQFPHSIRQMLFLPSGFGVSPEYRFRRTISAEEDVIEVSQLAYEFCLRNGLSRKRAMYVSVCIEELGMNAVRYGFSGKDQSAEVRISIVKDKLILRFRDDGKTFDLTKWFKIFRNEDKVSHLGIRILIGLSKEVSYTSALNTNSVVIQL